MNIDSIAKKMLDASGASHETPLKDEEGNLISAIAIVVSKENTLVGACATPYGMANAIRSLFTSLRTPQEKQLILMELIAEERGINNMPKPSANA